MMRKYEQMLEIQFIMINQRSLKQKKAAVQNGCRITKQLALNTILFLHHFRFDAQRGVGHGF